MTGFLYISGAIHQWSSWTFFRRRDFPSNPQPLTILFQCLEHASYHSLVFAKRFHRRGSWKFIALPISVLSVPFIFQTNGF